ncbi:rhamnopyranosyl-N-acetylglucosaminyl-diphospho-decaprenol beta-1,3/1,4-galactofuranosyltransferase [Mesocricetibacter intestinalis]|uniref:Rhamnopyranosyl-N-acetylglucosaminyl-diphospho-decaprenol beta-1,3/1,4-galactofuranosyltransferase n=1 Tax=Mesocricetibacter intestinalis TaxID=1521930 RepID=A0A4R6V8I3_9PAST|nr:glycosyltransferase [Mesocricetibacter intestinalis]TDQ57888.1 rhamnopyranosyl-N-acetylglucosaminyl-diphospho-decaprenol beta-1,3/1,4-galactofuranosyltransferase [Mesocricetibacter intestinalis]
MGKKTVCAVVVTYNRKNLLLNCLNALKAQSYPLEHIIVVDNASQDGTVDFLSEHGWVSGVSEKFSLISLANNQGGAGGFYAGIEFAYQRGFDYIWLMDDDGYPSNDSLAQLIPYCSDDCYIGPIVLDSQTKNKLSFSLRLPASIDVIDFYSKIPQSYREENIIKDIVLPFNGTLISSKLVQKMGLPHREYFIWGDEREYTIRAKKHQANILTVVSAIFYHPADSSSSTPMFFNKLRFNNANSNLKLYCFCRNSIALFSEHYGIHYSLAFWLKTTWFFSFTQPDLAKLKFTWRAMWHGLRKDFSHHKEYL